MSLDDKMDARQIVSEAGISAHPEFYSGRGAIRDDLNDRILEKVYQGVQREYGEEAAKQFVQMVADIPKLSATDFLLNLYSLEGQEWKWNKKVLGNENGIDVGPDYGEGTREFIAETSVLHVLGGMSDRDETAYIRGQFLRRHGIDKKERVRGDFYWD
jgi:hypothetical protein